MGFLVVQRAVILCFVWLLGLGTAVASPDPVTVDQAVTEHSLGLHLEYLEDAAGELQVEDILKPEMAARFSMSEKATPNFGFTGSVYWFSFVLENPGSEPLERLLQIAYPLLDDIHLYFIAASEPIKDLHLGDTLPFETRPVDHRSFVIPMNLKAEASVRVLIRVETTSSMRVPITLWESQAFLEKDTVESTIQGFFFGLILVMALYNLFVFISLRERSYLYYVLFVVGFAGFQAGLGGFNYQYLWPDYPWWSEHSHLFFLGLTEFSACFFAVSFLSLKEHAAKHCRYLTVTAYISGALALSAFFAPYPIRFFCEVMSVRNYE